MECLIFFAVAAVIALVIFVSHQRHQAWANTARELGFVTETKGPFGLPPMSGTWRGHDVRIEVKRSSSEDHDHTATRYSVLFPAVGHGLVLERRASLMRFFEFVGRDSLKIGDGEFDRAVAIRGRDALAARTFLTPERRREILTRFAGARHWVIRDGEIEFRRDGRDSSTALLRATLDDLVDLAEILSADPGPAPSEAPPPARPRGELEPAPQPEPEPEPLPESEPEPEPEPVRPSSWMEPDPAPVASPPAAALAAGDVSRALFAGGALRSESQRLFEERFEGREVRWSGTLERASSYYSDLVFGRGPGTRADVLLHELDHGGMKRKVVAVVQLAEGRVEELRARRGEPVTVAGRLVRADPFLRALFLADGILESG